MWIGRPDGATLSIASTTFCRSPVALAGRTPVEDDEAEVGVVAGSAAESGAVGELAEGAEDRPLLGAEDFRADGVEPLAVTPPPGDSTVEVTDGTDGTAAPGEASGVPFEAHPVRPRASAVAVAVAVAHAAPMRPARVPSISAPWGVVLLCCQE
ncbi:hypothetical protein [Catenulispora subtropica]|uniref:Uncharacterized protein n=1 Tax=Catenulispora subtropica TaxID=450798 RepID=A0ABP5CY04_9ACTN